MGDDLATEVAGASVIMATCGDERHPPENIIEPKDSSFWVTTGLYPQEFVIKLGSTSQVNKVRTLTSNGTCVCRVPLCNLHPSDAPFFSPSLARWLACQVFRRG